MAKSSGQRSKEEQESERTLSICLTTTFTVISVVAADRILMRCLLTVILEVY